MRGAGRGAAGNLAVRFLYPVRNEAELNAGLVAAKAAAPSDRDFRPGSHFRIAIDRGFSVRTAGGSSGSGSFVEDGLPGFDGPNNALPMPVSPTSGTHPQGASRRSPIECPRYELAVNLKTAKRLGITIHVVRLARQGDP